jgi:fructose/tagatose bisphosphate aldolase
MVLLYAKQHQFAIPAFNCTSTSTINAALEAARESKSPVIIQVLTLPLNIPFFFIAWMTPLLRG